MGDMKFDGTQEEWDALVARSKKQNDVTRLEVIDNNGRQYVMWDCKVELSYQDDGKTLKIFVTN